MNPYERVFARFQGLAVDRAPNFDIFMTYAAHFIRQPLSRYYQDFRVLCEANFAVQLAYDLDILQAISDPYREAADFGAEIDFPEDGLPLRRAPLLVDPASLSRLPRPLPEAGARMSDRLEAVALMAEQAKGQVPVMGWVEGALAEAAVLRGFETVLTDTYDRPDWLAELLERCTEVAIDFAVAQVEAGADIIGLGDAVASQISPVLYRKVALPYEQRIFEAVHAAGALARLHICGNTGRILDDMAASGADIIDIDWIVDLKKAAAAFGEKAVCGNFDPVAVMLRGTPDQVYRATLAGLEQGGERLFSAAGCEIPDGTPAENLHAQRRALLDFARGCVIAEDCPDGPEAG